MKPEPLKDKERKITMIIYIMIMFIGLGFGLMFSFFSLIGVSNQWNVAIIQLSAGVFGMIYVIKNFPKDPLDEYLNDRQSIPRCD